MGRGLMPGRLKAAADQQGAFIALNVSAKGSPSGPSRGRKLRPGVIVAWGRFSFSDTHSFPPIITSDRDDRPA
jgi:hypothetical protein